MRSSRIIRTLVTLAAIAVGVAAAGTGVTMAEAGKGVTVGPAKVTVPDGTGATSMVTASDFLLHAVPGYVIDGG
jgi:hypothetical protein